MAFSSRSLASLSDLPSTSAPSTSSSRGSSSPQHHAPARHASQQHRRRCGVVARQRDKNGADTFSLWRGETPVRACVRGGGGCVGLLSAVRARQYKQQQRARRSSHRQHARAHAHAHTRRCPRAGAPPWCRAPAQSPRRCCLRTRWAGLQGKEEEMRPRPRARLHACIMHACTCDSARTTSPPKQA